LKNVNCGRKPLWRRISLVTYVNQREIASTILLGPDITYIGQAFLK
jgi:hypothetical protein